MMWPGPSAGIGLAQRRDRDRMRNRIETPRRGALVHENGRLKAFAS